MSHETICRTLFLQAPGALTRELTAEDRALPRHWEGDLLIGARQGSSIATLAKRSTRYVVLVKLASRTADRVVARIPRRLQHLPPELCQTLTWDRGREMVAHQAFAVATDIPVYFCDPQSPWRRGTSETTNGPLRQYFPKTMDLLRIPQRRVNAVARELNNRSRATLDFRSPAENFNKLLR